MTSGQICFLGHSTFRLTLPDEREIFIDPWLVDNPSCPQQLKQPQRCDYVVLTHGHFDHTADVQALVKAHQPKVVAMFELAAILEQEQPAGQFLPMGLGGTQRVDDIEFTLTRAYHSAGYQSSAGLVYAGAPAGVVIRVPQLATIYHAGDTDVFSDMQLVEQMHAPSVVMLPIGDHFTMGPKGAAIAARYFNPTTILPMHYGTFPVLTGTVQAFREELGPDFAERVLALEPGQTADWT